MTRPYLAQIKIIANFRVTQAFTVLYSELFDNGADLEERLDKLSEIVSSNKILDEISSKIDKLAATAKTVRFISILYGTSSLVAVVISPI